MRFACEQCQTKYSIADEKVSGKVFKIRCKKCSNIIVVRGGAGAAEAAPAAQEKDTRVYDYGAEAGGGGDESVWHVVINQDQVGPMTVAEVQQKFSSGEIDGETYAWREGFADWMPLSQVDAFASMVSAGTTRSAAANGGGGGAAAVSAMFGGGDEAGTVRSDPGDLFSAASSTAARGGDDDGGDLFGSSGSRGGAAPAAAAGGSASANSKLRGERNENSVLFSLNNLAQLASDKPAPSASVVSTPSGHATGASGGEGSGLIDIRSMANAYLGGSAGAAKPAASVGSIDDLPVFGGGGFSEPAVLVPTAQRAGGNNKMMYMLIGSVGLLAVAAVIMVVVLLKSKGGDDNKNAGGGSDKVAMGDGSGDKKDPEGKTPDTKEPGAGSSEAKAPETKEPGAGSSEPATKTPETKEPETKTPETKEPETKKPDTKKPDTKRPDTKKPTTGGGGTTVAAKTPDPKKPAEPPPTKEPAGGGGCDEVSCVLNNYDGACCAKFKKGGKPAGGGGTTTAAKPSGGGSDLPDGLDRTMIQDGVNKVKARVMGCGDKSSAKGQVKVSVKVTPAGGVASVSVKSSPDAALGSCVASAMQKATFAKTQNGGSFAYPWNF